MNKNFDKNYLKYTKNTTYQNESSSVYQISWNFIIISSKRSSLFAFLTQTLNKSEFDFFLENLKRRL